MTPIGKYGTTDLKRLNQLKQSCFYANVYLTKMSVPEISLLSTTKKQKQKNTKNKTPRTKTK